MVPAAADIYSKSRMPWPKTGATHYHVQLGLNIMQIIKLDLVQRSTKI